MANSEKLDALLSRIAALGEWMIGRDFVGPDAEAVFEREVQRILARFSFVERDADWLDFLRRYGGATLVREPGMLSMGLYGLTHDASLHLLDGPGEPIECGCLNFADVVLSRDPAAKYTDDTISLGFGFEATGERRWGIYRICDQESDWYCETFLEWLERFVEKEGRLND